jgi:hypothetical protein
MKIILSVISLLIFLPSCTTSTLTAFSFGSVFKLSVPADKLQGSTVFYSDELSIKLNNGKLISGMVISNESENLPSEFDIRKYPDYIFGVRKIKDQNTELYRLFLNSKNEIAHTYDLNDLQIQDIDGVRFYSSCRELMCLAFIVKNSFKNHIFTVHSNGYDRSAFNRILQGEVNVK